MSVVSLPRREEHREARNQRREYALISSRTHTYGRCLEEAGKSTIEGVDAMAKRQRLAVRPREVDGDGKD